MNALRCGDREVHPQVRTLREMQSVVFDRDWLRTADLDQPLYLMYRNCVLPEDKQIAHELHVRYDITVLLPVMLGCEYNKTKGHYHSEYKPGLCYPELYQVLEGQAHVLLQKRSGDTVSDVVLVVAHEGEIVLVPPNYGHITINPTEKTLRMANWVSTKVQSFYEPFEQKGGGAYFVTSPPAPPLKREGVGKGLGLFIPNPQYSALPPLRVERAREYPELGLRHGRPIYELIKTPERLRFLSYPDE
uniref:glucose-6-phosphate isomerase n=2 Tax=Candidatus Bipolaricaulota TaxID=67810 RepID=H5SA11_9BACT|nr:glucose-6-phosphate isomerase, archaeal [uncultured Acetothermia bacterium]BAL60169.1 glucose-6-phosphate isomerase, archaeal [Candidatus Acetothermum autotrophicum]